MLTQKDGKRFWLKVQKGPGCWLWLANRHRQGYGWFQSGGKRGKSTLSHRVAWELTNGPIPTGMCVLHRCDNPPCVNPNHLFLGTKADNNHDRDSKGRSRGGSLPGEQHPGSRLSREQVLVIRLRASEGVAQQDLAKEYGVSYQHISDLVLRKRWAHIPVI